jgi:hypothetical protein
MLRYIATSKDVPELGDGEGLVVPQIGTARERLKRMARNALLDDARSSSPRLDVARVKGVHARVSKRARA